MKLSGKIRGPEGERLTGAEATSYDAAKAALDAQVHDGEQLVWIRRIDD